MIRCLRAKIFPGAGGFTMIELLVVLVILGLIAAFAVPQVMKYLGGAKSDAAGIQVQNLSTVLDLYRLDTGRYPTQGEGLDALLADVGDLEQHLLQLPGLSPATPSPMPPLPGTSRRLREA